MSAVNNTYRQAVDVTVTTANKYRYTLLTGLLIDTAIKNYEFEDTYFKLFKNGELIIFAGYAWDGASGAVNTNDFVLASLVHDVLYQSMRLKLLPHPIRPYADKLLLDIARANGMGWIRAHYSYLAVRAVGWRFS